MRGRIVSLIAAVVLTNGVSGGTVAAGRQSGSAHASAAPQIGAAIEQVLAANRGLQAQAVLDDLRAVYSAAPDELLWFDSSGTSREAARTALNLLARSAEDGLRPADYLPPGLTALLDTGRPLAVAERAAFDVTFSLAMLRYMRELRFGRVDSGRARVPHGWPTSEVNLAATLRSAVGDRGISSLASELAPPLIQYRLLRQQLDAYRGVVHDPALQGTLPTSSPQVLRPGEAYAGAALLHRRLLVLGDLSMETPSPNATYTDDVATGVRRFQRRHGLLDDGVIGRTTWAAFRHPSRGASARSSSRSSAFAGCRVSARSGLLRSLFRCSDCGGGNMRQALNCRRSR